MEILSKDVFDVLKTNGVESIYHANSVITACQFLRAGSLLSRGTVDRKRLYQTPQQSDANDKRYGIWFDIFADSVDIHHRAKRVNVYGPVLFVLDSQLIKRAYTGKVWVTKLNPTKWARKKHKQRWFVSADDLKGNFVEGDFNQMVVFRHCGGELPFRDYLREIVLDDPQKRTRGNIDYYSMAYGALTLAKTEGEVPTAITRRKCPAGCSCVNSYRTDVERTKKMFFPKPIE